MSQNFFSDIKIENFKSLHSVELKGCNRINLLIGKPNVGKSNILEALSLCHFITDETPFNKISFKELVRVDSETELFFDGEDYKNIKLTSNIYSLEMQYDNSNGRLVLIPNTANAIDFKDNVKKYIFKSGQIQLKSNEYSNGVLHFPFGDNLLNVIQNNAQLNKDCRELFKEYKLQLLFDKRTKSLMIAKKAKNELEDLPAIFTMPYGSVADTLQRIIFYKAAIASNHDTILLLEEPEAHSFLPYIVHITQEIINATSNQFFITTHSPAILDDLIQNARKDLAVFVVNWENGETVAKKLTENQLEEIYQYGIDLFTNIENYF